MKNSKEAPRKSPKSLRSILTLWFLAFTIIPLAFISGYSTVLYEHSLNAELQKRLEGNVGKSALAWWSLKIF